MVSFKYILFLFKIKKLKTFEDLAFSIENFPYRHITIGQGNSIGKGQLKDKRIFQDMEIYVYSNTCSGHVMTLENVKVIEDICSIHHLSLHPDYRKKKLGKPCINGLVKLLKKEKKITKMIFEERLGNRSYYQTFFNNTLKANIVTKKPLKWEILV